MKLELTVTHFEGAGRKKLGRKAPKTVYKGIVEFSDKKKRKNDLLELVLGGVLPIKTYLDSKGELICVANSGEKMIHFAISDKVSKGELSSASSSGRDFRTGSFVTWSASASICDM